jgi:recombination protein RecA
MYNEGISKAGDVLDLASQLDIITKRGSHYLYGEERLGQGRENAKAFLRDNQAMADAIEEKVRAHADPNMLLGGADESTEQD